MPAHQVHEVHPHQVHQRKASPCTSNARSVLLTHEMISASVHTRCTQYVVCIKHTKCTRAILARQVFVHSEHTKRVHAHQAHRICACITNPQYARTSSEQSVRLHTKCKRAYCIKRARYVHSNRTKRARAYQMQRREHAPTVTHSAVQGLVSALAVGKY